MSSAPQTQRLYTADDVLSLEAEDDRIYEVDDTGRLVETDMGLESIWIANRIAQLLWEYTNRHAAWIALTGEAGLAIWPTAPRRLRRADVLVVRRDRLPEGRLPSGWIEVAPELVVEVLSPRDNANRIDQKVQEYLEAGVRLVWVVYPWTRSVAVHLPDQNSMRYRAGASLGGGDVLPGLNVPVDEIFREP